MSTPPPTTVDILAIAAHRDDVEQTCGGTLLVQQSLGWRTGILDLTQGESGTRGTAEDRAREAAEAARILARHSPRGARPPRRQRREHARQPPQDCRRPAPPAPARRHPSLLAGPPPGPLHHRHAGLRSLLRRRALKARASARTRRTAPPVQDPLRLALCRRSPHLCRRHHAAYRNPPGRAARLPLPIRRSATAGSGLFVPEDDIRERTFATARHYGLLAGVRYAEPFVQKEVALANDLMMLPVQSI